MRRKQSRALLAGFLAASMSLASFCGFMASQTPVAYAEPPSDSDYEAALQKQEELKAQLAGVDEDLATIILELNDLTENKIPQAQSAYAQAQTASEQAQSLAASTTQRLQAAQSDKANLEEQIALTGEDFDDAKEAVAQLARESFHGSDASTIISVVTNATTTEAFVDSMQAVAAITRSEANAANEAAQTLTVSMNRRERLAAIEEQIAALKVKADQQAATAATAAATAQAKYAELEALRQEGAAKRAELEAQQSELTSQVAREAAEIVKMKSEIDAYNETLAKTGGSADPSTGGTQQVSPSSSGSDSSASDSNASSSSSQSAAPAETSSSSPNGMDYNPFGNCYEGMAYCYGHATGNTVGGRAYPWSQCTWYAYNRRAYYYHLPVGSYMGNGMDWARTGRRLGYLVNNIPHQGAAVVFQPGQAGADLVYGHVAIVERVNADGSILISETSAWLRGATAWRTVYNASAYEYVHY